MVVSVCLSVQALGGIPMVESGCKVASHWFRVVVSWLAQEWFNGSVVESG